MQSKGAIAHYDLHNDIIFYSARLCSLTTENKFQIFMHELAHAKDFRSCARNGLLKILVKHDRVLDSTFAQANEIFNGTVEFQASNFLYSEFCYRVRNPRFNYLLEYERNPIFFLIPSVEYFCFGENSDLREQFRGKLHTSLGQRWLRVDSFLESVSFADATSFETEFLRLMDCLGFTVIIKTEPIKNRRSYFRVLHDSTATEVKVFELVNNLDIHRFFECGVNSD